MTNKPVVKGLKKVIDLVLFGNIYVAAGAFCLVQSTCIQLGYKDRLYEYSFLVFFATLFIYNFQRIFYHPKEDRSLHSVRRKWIFNHQLAIKVLAATGFLGVAVLFFFNDHKILLYLSPLLLLSIAYFAPFVKLRKSPWFKLLTLVTVWTVTTAVVPIQLGPELITNNQNLLHIMVRFSFMMAICIPFDIRDLEIDRAENVLTLPQRMGVNKTRWLAVVFMFLYIFLILPEYLMDLFSFPVFIALIASAFINTIFVFRSTPERTEYFYVAGLDGTMILQGVLLMLAEWRY
jgi:4-hydroxybenzoate polyprenyltransferase